MQCEFCAFPKRDAGGAQNAKRVNYQFSTGSVGHNHQGMQFVCCAIPCEIIYTLGPFKSFVTNNKGFRNLFCNPQKSFHTSPTRIIEAVNHSSNSTISFTNEITSSRNFFY